MEEWSGPVPPQPYGPVYTHTSLSGPSKERGTERRKEMTPLHVCSLPGPGPSQQGFFCAVLPTAGVGAAPSWALVSLFCKGAWLQQPGPRGSPSAENLFLCLGGAHGNGTRRRLRATLTLDIRSDHPPSLPAPAQLPACSVVFLSGWWKQSHFLGTWNISSQGWGPGFSLPCCHFLRVLGLRCPTQLAPGTSALMGSP